jgi:CRISPR-associated protein Cmr6
LVAGSFYETFGTTEHQGAVVFFDAYPTRAPLLEADILNPHYGDYYLKGKPPGDYYNPIPTFFLTVAKDSEFRFAISGKSEALVNNSNKWLQRALADFGVGGKTASGYGYFNQKAPT